MQNSPQESDDSVIVARINGPHGRDGALSVELLSDLPGRFDVGRELLVDGTPRLISNARQTGPSTALITLDGIKNRSQASALSGKFLSAPPVDDVSLDEGEFFHYQLIGMQVRAEDGEELGEIQEILETGSNDVYIVRGPSGEVLIPAIPHVVLDVDLSAGVMLVRLPDGLR